MNFFSMFRKYEQNMYKIVLIIVAGISLMFLHSAFSEDARDPNYLFYKASSAYEEGCYEEAINAYERILERNIENGALYYNLGNCYFKIGQLGKAILNYERARRLIPRDGDLGSNYTYARSLVKETLSEKKQPWFMRVVTAISKHFTVNEMTVVSSMVFLLIIIVLIVKLFIQMKTSHVVAVMAILGILFMMTCAAITQKVVFFRDDAIVTVEETEARFEPREEATAHFTLFEGVKVRIIQSKDEWHKIERLDGKAGWVLKHHIEKI